MTTVTPEHRPLGRFRRAWYDLFIDRRCRRTTAAGAFGIALALWGTTVAWAQSRGVFLLSALRGQDQQASTILQVLEANTWPIAVAIGGWIFTYATLRVTVARHERTLETKADKETVKALIDALTTASHQTTKAVEDLRRDYNEERNARQQALERELAELRRRPGTPA